MGNCLKTTLKGVVNNDTLLRENEISFELNVTKYAYFTVTTTSGEAVNYRMVGGLKNSGGNTEGQSTGTGIIELMTGTSGIIFLDHKYDINYLNTRGVLANVDNLSFMTGLQKFTITSHEPMSSLKGLLRTSPEIRDIGMTVLSRISDNSNINDVLQDFPLIYHLVFENRVFDPSNDIALLTNLHYFDNDRGGNMTWTTRPSTAKILAGHFYLADLDNMLINQANCQASSSLSSGDMILRVFGNCSFSSEVTAAIEAIKAKGYTVKINEVIQ